MWVALALSCATGWAQNPNLPPDTLPQQGVPPNDMGPRSMPQRGFPPEPNGLPPRPGSPESRSPQSRLPPTAPTQAPAPPQPTPSATPALGLSALPSPTAATPDAAGAGSKPHLAQVSFQNGLLEVRANDSSLQQILRSVVRRTGMKITGGVADQRVFGDYGPAPASSVLATLLDGTGVNMLLQTTPQQVPVALVLTPQTGTVTAPTLDMSQNDDAADSPPPGYPAVVNPSGNPALPSRSAAGSASGPVSVPQPLNNVNGSPSNTSPTASTFPTTNSVPLNSLPTPSTTPSSSGIVDSPNPPPPGSTTSQSPNGVATPESIYQQLLQMQKQQQQKQQNGTPPQ
jgi:hypothetical protein